MSERSVQLKATMDAQGVAVGAQAGKRSLKELAAAAKDAGQEIGTSISDAGAKTTAAASQIEAETNRAAQSIQRTIARLESAGKGQAAYFEQLFSARGVDINALRPLLDQLAEVEARQKKAAQAAAGFASGTDAAGKSAQQLAYQLRQVGPQVTDIVTGLASGQAPLTVLIQQGGQLKDVFGGIGPAAKALGGYLAGLINPFSVAAAAAGALAVAFVKGAGESEAYNKALILTGNAAGTTAGQLADMARRIASVSGTQSQAAAALAEMAGSTKIGARNLEEFSRVAIQIEKLVGQPIAETRKQFEELGRSPVDASRKLNDATNFLTGSLYSQIRALEDQGKAAEAASLPSSAPAAA
jgi:phage-related minor tail protein